jgi:hypothetical protein
MSEDTKKESWSGREIRLACERERELAKAEHYEVGAEYGIMCYESAKKAYDSLMDDGHSNNSIWITMNVLERLIDGKPLTAVEDTPDSWNQISSHYNGYTTYQHTRMSGLFKDVYDDGTIHYNDIDRIRIVDEQNPDCLYSSNRFLTSIAEEVLGNVTMPYYPMTRSIKVITEYLLSKDGQKGDFDTVGIKYAVMPSGGVIQINRYFQFDSEDPVEINQEEFMRRKDLDDRRKVNHWNDTKKQGK